MNSRRYLIMPNCPEEPQPSSEVRLESLTYMAKRTGFRWKDSNGQSDSLKFQRNLFPLPVLNL